MDTMTSCTDQARAALDAAEGVRVGDDYGMASAVLALAHAVRSLSSEVDRLRSLTGSGD